MENSKFFVLVIFVIVFAFQSALTMMDYDEINVHNKYTADQLLGNWFFIAAVNIVPQSEPIQCVTLTMRKTENRQYVEIISSTLDDDFSHKYNWMTQVYNDKLHHYIITNDTASKPIINSFDIFTDQGLFVIYNVTPWQTHAIYSRHTNVAKNELKKYELIAKENKYNFQYVNSRICRRRLAIHQNFNEASVYYSLQ
ncbi:hypothetical protein PV325_004685 [Microctonus aethiopoides]|nr:hypothetical protein PV325_004685 [Microctonus aethiopoides]